MDSTVWTVHSDSLIKPRTPFRSRANCQLPSSGKTEMPPQFMEKRSQATATYPPVRNRLAEQEKMPMNQTYTIGSNSNAQRQTTVRRQRSGSIDSDITDYCKMSNTIVGIFPRTYGGNNQLTSLCRKPAGQNQTISRMLSNKLPSLDGCSPERICCQRPWTRTQFELAKFKDTLNQLN
ncbi:hypothetical protein M3Y98_00155700 [Aphelenchoides besseyi]|nr:hypothetical protein M3Y98_00155700 [Aphelenchoides besseyi]KAI6199843.1 hypothetical protein M3Y96_00670100 [Aphelenchoides besseyi]